MRFNDLNTDKGHDVEHVKQQIQELQLVLDEQIIPNKNHKLFEYDVFNKKLNLASFKPSRTEILWSEALQMYNSKVEKIDINNPNPKSKYDVIKNPNCLYFFALNEENALKKLKNLRTNGRN